MENKKKFQTTNQYTFIQAKLEFPAHLRHTNVDGGFVEFPRDGKPRKKWCSVNFPLDQPTDSTNQNCLKNMHLGNISGIRMRISSRLTQALHAQEYKVKWKVNRDHR